jgi:hypothetical protein
MHAHVTHREVDIEENDCVWDRSPTHPSRPTTCSYIRLFRYDERYQERYSYRLQRSAPEQEEATVAAQGKEAKSDATEMWGVHRVTE